MPLGYPGVWPPDSVVVSDKRMWKVTDRDGATLAWDETPPVRLGACRVRNVRAADRQDSVGTAPQPLGRAAALRIDRRSRAGGGDRFQRGTVAVAAQVPRPA